MLGAGGGRTQLSAMLRPDLSSPPAYLEVLDECGLLGGWEVRAAYVAPDVPAILVTLPDDPPAWAHSAPLGPHRAGLDVLAREDVLVALVLL